MIVQVLALLLFLVFVAALFRFAMGLRQAKTARERARAEEEAAGRRVVAELPTSEGVVFLLEDAARFRWGAEVVAKADVTGARLLVNGAVVREFALPSFALPPPSTPEEFEGRERWDVIVYRRSGPALCIPCGSLREGVSREVGGRAFEAIRSAAGGEGRKWGGEG